MVVRNGIDPGFHIRQILEEEFCHIHVDALSVRHGRIATDTASSLWLFPFANSIGEFAKHETVSNVPGDSRKLGYAISQLRDGARELRRASE